MVDTNEAMTSLILIYYNSLEEFRNMRFDFSKTVVERVFSEADYRVRVIASAKKLTKGKKDKFELKLQILNPGELEGVIFKDDLVCSEAAYERVKSAFDAMEITKPGEVPVIEVEAQDLVNRELDVRTTNEIGTDEKERSGIGWSGYLLPGTGKHNLSKGAPQIPPATTATTATPVASEEKTDKGLSVATAEPAEKVATAELLDMDLDDDDVPF
jgi:hypothetical protein